MKKLLCLAAATLMLGGLAAFPTAAMAAGTAPPPAKHMTHKATAKHHMHHRVAHKRSCYDYAWQSQQMKDCVSKAGSMSKPMAKKTSAKKHMKKHMTMKKS